MQQVITNFNDLTLTKKIMETYKIIKLITVASKLLCSMNNISYNPIYIRIADVEFKEKVVRKNCPNRLLVGQRGGLSKFYREIAKCIKHNWLFEEILNNEPVKTYQIMKK